MFLLTKHFQEYAVSTNIHHLFVTFKVSREAQTRTDGFALPVLAGVWGYTVCVHTGV